jgi:hypothetical protein
MLVDKPHLRDRRAGERCRVQSMQRPVGDAEEGARQEIRVQRREDALVVHVAAAERVAQGDDQREDGADDPEPFADREQPGASNDRPQHAHHDEADAHRDRGPHEPSRTTLAIAARRLSASSHSRGL